MEFSLGQVAQLVGGDLQGPAERTVSGIQGIEQAGPSDLTFLANPKYAPALESCRAGVVLVGRAQKTPPELAVIRVDNPYLAYAKLLTAAFTPPYEPLGVDSRAVVHPSARIGPDCSVHPLAVVGAEAKLGSRVVIHSGAVLGRGVSVGDDTVIHPNVVIYDGCVIGSRCIIHGGSVIGADGYGFVFDGSGHYKIPQVGIVQIDDEVEIGAGNTIDRAANGRTWIQRGVKTDDQVHIAHGCTIGENSLLVAQVGISGSSKLGKGVVLGGKVGVAGHIEIGDGVQVGGGSGVAQSIEPGQIVSGYPVMPHRLWLRTRSLVKKLPELFKRVKQLEQRLGEDESKERSDG
ncbi:MAG: UDP-3-O-(3-hydroxymyristoyl)glucosamine N-acyltransferase [Desulfarculaceae bacterium]|nr:UDP-3-O-(3-hydroxymyristoyl)glucosamine N-acyltransferase [Desulfarculaceae bacterium]MCF8072240.1 UDP-3-O-(3-hydroxymyristoyl)glucosamine N-acyltransferase [Desulfarculaceae bacterium]MCF8100161.1 UDP-3-O-(3-hydroxymyristoyl)glucosamine N-acyltransferase [Desulfarculaceae bacterium]MCF8117896.1 UDP-3-O-(3-hydroxymyristoyl)glucosamine N-acyltransferase [Desulfarculaceae bacterium]